MFFTRTVAHCYVQCDMLIELIEMLADVTFIVPLRYYLALITWQCCESAKSTIILSVILVP